jgi:hypothetical protein
MAGGRAASASCAWPWGRFGDVVGEVRSMGAVDCLRVGDEFPAKGFGGKSWLGEVAAVASFACSDMALAVGPGRKLSEGAVISRETEAIGRPRKRAKRDVERTSTVVNPKKAPMPSSIILGYMDVALRGRSSGEWHILAGCRKVEPLDVTAQSAGAHGGGHAEVKVLSFADATMTHGLDVAAGRPLTFEQVQYNMPMVMTSYFLRLGHSLKAVAKFRSLSPQNSIKKRRLYGPRILHCRKPYATTHRPS